MSGGSFRPGDHVRWFADTCGWRVYRRTIIVEGDTDVRYLNLASDLHERNAGTRLLNDELGVVSAGFGNAGGTLGIVEKFPALQQIIQRDCGPNGKPLFRAIALVDDDYEGNNACSYLTNRYTNLLRNRDVFVLQRVFPRESQSPRVLEEKIKQANEKWATLDCEIEDLLSKELIDVFVEEFTGALKSGPQVAGGAHHFDFTSRGKSEFCRWASTIAQARDLAPIVELLKSLRYYLGLNPDGQ